mmetsp:Transcript_40393/g.94487  ORF Transcript_40393/g.94487 Transcript_40393/m.94487 type:complete len:241 (+) Transcript_40393:204-926(+)
MPKKLFTRARINLKARSKRVVGLAGLGRAVRRTRRLSRAEDSSKSMQFVTVPAFASTTLQTLAAPRVLFFVKVASAAVVNSKLQAPCNGQSDPSDVPKCFSGSLLGVYRASKSASSRTRSAAFPRSSETARKTPAAAKFFGARSFLSSSPPFTPKSILKSPPLLLSSRLKSFTASKSSRLAALCWSKEARSTTRLLCLCLKGVSPLWLRKPTGLCKAIPRARAKKRCRRRPRMAPECWRG